MLRRDWTINRNGFADIEHCGGDVWGEGMFVSISAYWFWTFSFANSFLRILVYYQAICYYSLISIFSPSSINAVFVSGQ